MKRIKKDKSIRYNVIIGLVCLLLLSMQDVCSYAQDAVFNPLSRMGYGTLVSPSSTAWKAMGGVGIGMNDNKVINIQNPAAYAATDSLSFLLETAAILNAGLFDDNGRARRTILGTIDYLAVQFPVYRNLIAVSAGLKPFSIAAYTLSDHLLLDGKLVMLQTFKGKGSIQNAYLGVGGRLFKNLYIGANINYIFGSLEHTVANTPTSTIMASSIESQTLRMKGITTDLGIQYNYLLDTKTEDILTFGAIYTPALPITLDRRYQITENTSDAMRHQVHKADSDSHPLMPHKFGIGVSWTQPMKYKVAADFKYALWTKASNPFVREEVMLSDTYSVALGAEYLPDAYSRNYFKVMKYRFGLNYKNACTTYAPVGQVQQIGASLGAGIPVNLFGADRFSTLNVAIGYEHHFTTNGFKLQNNVLSLTLGISFNETWFRELKIY